MHFLQLFVQFSLIVGFVSAANPSKLKSFLTRHGSHYIASDDLTLPSCAEPGNFTLPKSCSSYISCDSNLVMTIQSCPKCNPSAQCHDGQVYFNSETRRCDLPFAEERCKPPTTTTTTTTTTSAPSSTSPPEDECTPPCSEIGWCDCYDICRADNTSSTGGRWELKILCPQDLYWNPSPQGGSDVHGGSCDFFENLSLDLQEQYRQDKDCYTPPIECYWKPDTECDNYYYYLPPGEKNENNRVKVKCPVSSQSGESLFWDQDKLTCVKCPAGKQCKECSK